MASTTEWGRIGAVRVWITPPRPYSIATDGRNGYLYDWLPFASWTECKRLIPQASTELPGGCGNASFQLLRRTREENGQTVTGVDNVYPGAYVCITGGTDTFSLAKALWFGWITNVDSTQITGQQDQTGTVTACGLGDLLDGTQITGWKKFNTGGTYGEALNTPPSANITVSDGVVVGNYKSGYFATLPADCGFASTNYWTRHRLLTHLVAYCTPSSLPGLTLSYAAGVQTALDDTSWPEVFELTWLTFKGALDLLIPRSRGLGWRLWPNATGWTISVYTHDADGTFTAVNTPTAVDTRLYPVKSIGYNESAADDYDEVVVRGAPILFGVTVGFPDGNLGAGWTTMATAGDGTQEDLYRKGARLETADTDGGGAYASWTSAKKIIRNTEVRQGPALERVFSVYSLNAYNGNAAGEIKRRDPPGDGTGALRPLIPNVSWTGSTVTLDPNLSRLPYLPTARVSRCIPWPRGVQGDGTDTRDAASKAQPEYLQPRVFRYLASAPAAEPYKWVNLLAHGNKVERGSPAIEADDRSLGIRVTYSPPEVLAKNHWTTGTDGIGGLDPDDPNTSSKGLDYTALVVTLGIESDQRLEVSTAKAGAGGFVRKRLVINDERLQCWVMLKNSILGIKSDGAPDRATLAAATTTFAEDNNKVGYLIRNDYPTAQKICNLVSAWVFRRRISATIQLARPDQTPSFASIGFMLGRVTEADATTSTPAIYNTCNTVVEEISRDYSLGNASVTIRTSIAERPEIPRYGGGGSSPQSGGSVSASIGGTTPQAVAALQEQQQKDSRDRQRQIIVPPRVPGAGTPQITLQIFDGNTVYNTGGNTIYGIKRKASALTTVSSLWDPNGAAATKGAFAAEDGIGRARLYIDGVIQPGFVLVVHDNRTGNLISTTLVEDDAPTNYTTVSLPLASDSTQTVAAYLPFYP